MAEKTIKYAIEDSFPIVEINRLAVPERNAFKPIYQMHKWFARRASCVFRAILLGCMKPLSLDEKGNPIKSGAEIIMEEFYKDHTNDPDTKGKVILDPFMGGGTTIVEALRLGCKVIGIDLNPVAWFIVKTEVEPVDIEELKKSFERLAERKVAWSGKSVKETLLEQYKTECACCGAGREEADIIYTFWVKSALCTACKKEVPLFSDYLIAAKTPSIRYFREAECPECKKSFDWEVEPAGLVAEPSLCVVSPGYSAGIGRSNIRWAYSSGDSVKCPWCQKKIKPRLKSDKKERKKVPLSVLLCPHCYSVWQWRGELPDEVSCPACRHSYNPNQGNVPKSGWFVCSCGHTDRIINSIRSLPKDRLLPMRPYAIEGYCSNCSGGNLEELEADQMTLGEAVKKKAGKKAFDHSCLISKNNGKFFKRIKPADLARYQKAGQSWEKEKAKLPYPKQEVPWGEKTKSGLIAHHYYYWHQMFNPRQLLCLATLLKAIDEEKEQILKEMLLLVLSQAAERNNMFCRYFNDRNTIQGNFDRHDFQPKLTPAEGSVFGHSAIRGTFPNLFERLVQGKIFCKVPFDWSKGNYSGKSLMKLSSEKILGTNAGIFCQDASRQAKLANNSIRLIITDPPYVGNVNYSELSDFFYVWLRLILAGKYSQFASDFTPKAEEIIENPTRGKSSEDFGEGLTQVFKECKRILDKNGILSFTFHHTKGQAWEILLRAVCNAGFEIASVYPVHGEKESSLNLQDTASISYDLIHICRKRPTDQQIEKRSWAGIRQEIRRKAREEIKVIVAGRYGQEPLSPEDIKIILIGKCLELYSRHYGAVLDHQGEEVPLKDALEEIRMLVDQLQSREQPLPSELSDIDPESYIYLTSLCHIREIKSDDVHKATRGILEPEELMKAAILIKGRTGRGRTYEVKQPQERFTILLEKFKDTPLSQENLFGEIELPKAKKKIYFVDYLHFLMALVEGGENIVPWLDRFRGETPRIRAAIEYLKNRNKNFAPTLKKILDLIEIGPLFKGR